jgi:calcium-dependent protein kinase
MKKISEHEENEMYNMMKISLFALCDEKPNHPVEFLAKKMLELAGQTDTYVVVRKQSTKFSSSKFLDVNINIDKLMTKNMTKNFADNYKIVTRLGWDVFIVEDLKMPEVKKAVKMINKDKGEVNGIPENIIGAMLTLDHPNVVKIFDIIEDEFHIFIIEDYCDGGDLFNYIVKTKSFSEDMAKKIIKQILDGISYLHEKGITHRAIKPENILIFNNSPGSDEITIKISDFTSASFTSNAKVKVKTKDDGPPYYIAPEVIEGKYNQSCDLWSLGVVAYTMLCGKPPYLGKMYEILFRILHEDYEFTQYHSESARSFIKNLLVKDPTKRPSAKDTLEHPWLSSGEENDSNFDKQIGVSIMNEMSQFVQGKNLRKSVLSYILSRKFYVEKNNQLMNLFKDLDKDGNGHISVSEIYAEYGKFFPGTPQESWEKVKLFVEKVDINQNGTIEYSEFLAVSSLLHKELNQNILKEVFDYYDNNGSGFIQANDLKEIFEDTDISDVNFQIMIDEFDKDGDRQISFNEFYEMITKSY